MKDITQQEIKEGKIGKDCYISYDNKEIIVIHDSSKLTEGFKEVLNSYKDNELDEQDSIHFIFGDIARLISSKCFTIIKRKNIKEKKK